MVTIMRVIKHSPFKSCLKSPIHVFLTFSDRVTHPRDHPFISSRWKKQNQYEWLIIKETCKSCKRLGGSLYSINKNISIKNLRKKNITEQKTSWLLLIKIIIQKDIKLQKMWGNFMNQVTFLSVRQISVKSPGAILFVDASLVSSATASFRSDHFAAF